MIQKEEIWKGDQVCNFVDNKTENDGRNTLVSTTTGPLPVVSSQQYAVVIQRIDKTQESF